MELMLILHFILGRERASLPGFKVLPLRQFGTWGPVMADEYDPQKDTYVLVSKLVTTIKIAAIMLHKDQ